MVLEVALLSAAVVKYAWVVVSSEDTETASSVPRVFRLLFMS